MPLYRLFPALLFLLATALAHAEYREFTAQDGRTMKAELINVVGDKVRLKREDGSSFNVSPSAFSKEDQEYITLWMLRELSGRDSLLDIQAKSSGTTPKEVNVGTGILAERWDGYYKIKLTNKSDLPLEGIQIMYGFWAFHMEMGADRRREGKTEIVQGELTIPQIKARSDFEFDSVKADMLSTELARGYYWADGGKDKSLDKLEGIWIRIYYDDQLIQEWSNPSSLKEKNDWSKVYKK